MSGHFSQRGIRGAQFTALGLIIGALACAFTVGYFLGISHKEEEEEQRKEEQRKEEKSAANQVTGGVLCVVIVIFSTFAFYKGWFNNVDIEQPIVADYTDTELATYKYSRPSPSAPPYPD